MKTIVTILILILLLCNAAIAQKCGTDEINKELMESDSVFANFIKQDKLKWESFVKGRENALILPTPNGPVYEIPVVVHIIHTGEALGSVFNPTDTQIKDWIENCNEVFAAEYAPFADTADGGVRIPIRLTLASRSPSCGPTTGINRFDGSNLPGYNTYGVKYVGSNGVDELTLKSLTNWPSSNYYNLYLVKYIDGPGGQYAGYAYYPGASALKDGAVILTKHTAPIWNGKYWQVLSHELGHALGLRHTFEGDDFGCPINSNCTTDGDGICDTEPHKKPTGCPSGINSCTGLIYNDVQYNIMNYSDCPDRFTEGQKTRMLYTLLNNRYSLLTSLATTAPESQDSLHLTASCIPPPIIYNTNNVDIGPREIRLEDVVLSSQGYSDDGSEYIDWNSSSCLQKSTATLQEGGSYMITVKTGYNKENVMGWIDFNNDGVFQDVEEILNAEGTISYETFTEMVVLPPGTVTCTPLRARIASDYIFSPTPEPCSGLYYGQTEDFSVIIEPAATPYGINITSSAGSICQGDTVVFTAQVTGGTPLNYFWRKNGIDLGITAAAFNPSDLNHSDTISCIITHHVACGTGTTSSNEIVMNVKTNAVPSVNISANPSLNLSPGQAVQFNADTADIGSNPIFQWRRNGIDIIGANTGIYNTTAGAGLQHDDELSLYIKNTDVCAKPDTAISNVLKLSISTAIAGINQKQNPVILFPNPNNGSFNITGSGMGENNSTLQLDIYDIMGKKIFETAAQLNSGILDHTIHLEGKLPAGTYLLKVAGNEQVAQNIFIVR